MQGVLSLKLMSFELAEAKHPDMICIVELWLSTEIPDNELLICN